jgi:diadenosine tetraphosphate (Ap4A) HIT family hydrolase
MGLVEVVCPPPQTTAGSYVDENEERRRRLCEGAQSSGVATPDGYNIGINVGEAAGQTVMHLHVHVIPRFVGDVEDPTGGVRGVIPGKSNYRLM